LTDFQILSLAESVVNLRFIF